MSELETSLRRLAKNGELTYLSLIPVAGKGENGVVFHATVSPASKWGNMEGRDADPVKALLAALEGLPKSFVKPTREELQEAYYDRAETGLVINSAPEPWDITS
jgi:hypothetical protein